MPTEHKRRFDRVIIALLALVVVVFAVDRFVLVPARNAESAASTDDAPSSDAAAAAAKDTQSIAVLAFADLSPAGDQEYFSDGISVELTNLLAKIPALRVAGRTSAFSFKGRNAGPAEIGETLNVGHLLDGTVSVESDRVRIAASLIDAGTGTEVWSYTPEARPLSDVFAIQDEIAAEVVEALQVALADEMPRLDETNPEAYTLFLQARQILNSARRDDVPRARELLERVVELDDRYYPARIELADAYRALGTRGAGQIEAAEAERLALETVEDAAAIWPGRVEIKVYRAQTAFAIGDLGTAAGYLEAAIAQDPGLLDALAGAQFLLIRLNRPEQAIDIGQRILARDPICVLCHAFLIQAYFEARRFDEAVAAGREARELGLTIPPTPWFAASLLLSGDAEAALAEYQAYPQPQTRLMGSAMAYHALGRDADAEAAMVQLNELSQGLAGIYQAFFYSNIGDIDVAFEIMNNLPLLLPDVLSDPLFDPLREDPRWDELAGKAGLGSADPRNEIEFAFEFPE